MVGAEIGIEEEIGTEDEVGEIMAESGSVITAEEAAAESGSVIIAEVAKVVNGAMVAAECTEENGITVADGLDMAETGIDVFAVTASNGDARITVVSARRDAADAIANQLLSLQMIDTDA